MPRNSIFRLRAATAAALLSLSLAAPALAHDWDDDRGRRAYRDDEPRDRDAWRGDGWRDRDGDRDGWGDRGDWNDRGRWNDRGAWDRGGWNGGGWNERGRDRYYDRRDTDGRRPCHRRFGDRAAFSRHLAREYGIPFWAFPRIVAEAPWGAAYFGR